MAEFIFNYRAPKGYVPGSADNLEAWNVWFGGMGPALIDIGKPVVDRQEVGSCGAEETQLNGFSIVQADDLEAALVIAAGCPFVGDGGGVEVGELTDLG